MQENTLNQNSLKWPQKNFPTNNFSQKGEKCEIQNTKNLLPFLPITFHGKFFDPLQRIWNRRKILRFLITHTNLEKIIWGHITTLSKFCMYMLKTLILSAAILTSILFMFRCLMTTSPFFSSSVISFMSSNYTVLRKNRNFFAVKCSITAL
jgi:hypothetical protein